YPGRPPLAAARPRSRRAGRPSSPRRPGPARSGSRARACGWPRSAWGASSLFSLLLDSSCFAWGLLPPAGSGPRLEDDTGERASPGRSACRRALRGPSDLATRPPGPYGPRRGGREEGMELERSTQQEMLRRWVEPAGRRVVDIGCGSGELVRWLRSEGAEAIGVECGEVMMRLAREADPEHPEAYLDGVGQALPLPDASVDAAVMSFSLHHVPREE